MAIFKNYDTYNILLLKRTKDGTKVYYSNYLKENVFVNKINLDAVVDSFKELELPIIKQIGSISYSNITYPLFKTIYDDCYIIDSDYNIKKIALN